MKSISGSGSGNAVANLPTSRRFIRLLPLLALTTFGSARANEVGNPEEIRSGTHPHSSREVVLQIPAEGDSKPLPGRRVYKRVCMACHTSNLWGAPKLGDPLAWEGRISKGREALYFSARNGFNAMPARGYCQFCTDADLEAAVDYMIEKAGPRNRSSDSRATPTRNPPDRNR